MQTTYTHTFPDGIQIEWDVACRRPGDWYSTLYTGAVKVGQRMPILVDHQPTAEAAKAATLEKLKNNTYATITGKTK